QILPIAEQLYLGSSGKRQLLKSREMEYGLQEMPVGWKWNVMSKESLFDGNKKLTDKIEYTHYDKYGNPVEMVGNDSRHTVFLWSHYGQNLRAR
ncbi:UNVERIFIED_CONTAM: hypothetical protein NY100_17970, partial [Prevotella sp. 15_C9]